MNATHSQTFCRGAVLALLLATSLHAQDYGGGGYYGGGGGGYGGGGATYYSQNITFYAPSDQTLGTPAFALAATAGSGLAVTYVSNSPSVCTVSGIMVTLVSAGTCSITASQNGDGTYYAATPVTQTFTVHPAAAAAPASQTISFATIPAHAFGDPPFSLAATGGASGNPVTFAVTSGPASISGSIVTITGAGTVTITASQAGNSNYNAATAVQVFTVGKGSQTVTFAAIPAHGGADAPFPLQATSSAGLPITFTVVSGPATTGGSNGSTLTLGGVGTVTVQAAQAGSANYNAAAPATQTFTVSLSAPAIAYAQNAASYISGTLAPASYAALFGSSIDAHPSTTGPVTASVTLKDASGVQTPLSMLYSDFHQINVLVPASVAVGQATITVSNSAGASTPYPVTIGKVAPGLFSADGSGQGAPAAQALVVAPDGAQSYVPVAQCSGSPVVCTTVTIPLTSGSQVYLILYGTGVRGRSSLNNVSLLMGGAVGSVTFAGAQGSFPGLDQIDVQVPSSLAGQGEMDLKLTVDGVAANTLRVRF